MPDETDAKQILTASPAGNWRPLGRPHITWMKTIQQDLKSSDLNMDDAVDLAQNRPLWRVMSTFGVTHSKWCLPEMMMMILKVKPLAHCCVCPSLSVTYVMWLNCTSYWTTI